MKTNLEKQLKSIINTVETLGNCHICFHDFYRHILEHIPNIPLYHQNQYCIELKKMLPEQDHRCIKFDRSAVQHHLETCRTPFFKLCPYQVLELVVPVLKGDILYGVIFMGPFRAAAPLPVNSLIVQSRKLPTPMQKKLPGLDVQGMEHIANLGYMLSCCISEIICDVELPATPAQPGRKTEIEQFIVRNYNKGISLDTLAEFLELSESRTSRLLKEYFNTGLTELVNRQRLNYASNLLLRSEITIREAAQRAGFSSIEYFHRIFRKHTGITPLEYRRRQLQKSDHEKF